MNYLPEYLDVVSDISKPDPIRVEDSTIDPHHVMSRDADGNIVSVYGDPNWDLTMFPGNFGKFRIDDFVKEIASKNNVAGYRHEVKTILFRTIYNSRARAMNTVAEQFNILKRHARFAARKGLSIKDSLSDRSILDFIVNDPELNKRQIARRLIDAAVLFSSLHQISSNIDDFEFYPSDRVFRYLTELTKEYPSLPQQTPIIPTRILSRRIQTCFEYIDKFLEHKESFGYLWKFREDSKKEYMRSRNISEKHAASYASRALKKELKKNKHVEFAVYFGVTDFLTLRGVVGKVRLPIVEMIHAFSGMRVGESSSIAMDGFRILTIGRHEVPVIRSYTTKMARDSGYFADWVTSPELERAFEAANIMNFSILSHEFDCSPEEIDKSSVPLFLSNEFGAKGGTSVLYEYPMSKISLNSWGDHPINQDPEMIVKKEDFSEILAVDSDADSESLAPLIEVGKPFSFQTHMYRRSLAVYTARSGLVSLPTLKNQLKHIKIQTSAYYGNDSTFANNLIMPKSDDQAFDGAVISQRGFIKEFQDELIEAQADLLFDEVITSDEVVFGGMGTQIQKQKVSGTLPAVFADWETIKKAIKKGRLRYVETPLGGCMAREVCDRIAFSSITTCVGCGSSVFNHRTVPLLEKTKEDYEKRLETFGTSTPYGRQLERDIRDIETVLKMREKLIELVDVTETAS